MNTNIYYFSGTGNSLVVARDLAAELGNTRVLSITRALKAGVEESADAIGIVFPIYMFGLPLVVADFLKGLRIKPGAYVFLAATLGGLPGRALNQGQEILKGNGIKMAAGFLVFMPGNYTPLYGARPKEDQQKMFEQEKIKIKDIASLVRERKSGIIEQRLLLLSLLLYTLFYRLGSAMVPKLGKNFWVTDSCTKCGICGKICPVKNIEMPEGKPVWLDHCQHCMACLQWCPVEAIQYKKSTLGRKRYRHPDVSEQDIMAQQ